jgi:hypothetical protein
VQRFFREALGLEGLLIFVSLACLAFLVFVGRCFELRPGKVRLLLLLFPIGIWVLRRNPEEAVHLIEYGALALSLLWGQGTHQSNKHALKHAAVISVAVGFGDELLQGINPERFFDLRDIVINLFGSFLALTLFRLKVETSSTGAIDGEAN